MNNINPKTKLSSVQRQMVLKRVMERESSRPSTQSSMPMPMAPQGDLAQGIVGGQMPQMLPNAMGPAMPAMPMPVAGQSVMQNTNPTNIDQLTTRPEMAAPDELNDVEKQIQAALIADQLWKDSGGNESFAADVWGMLKKGSKAHHLDSPRDYFVSSFVKYTNDPVKFKKSHPQEARLIKQLKDEFNASQTESMVPEGAVMEGNNGIPI